MYCRSGGGEATLTEKTGTSLITHLLCLPPPWRSLARVAELFALYGGLIGSLYRLICEDVLFLREHGVTWCRVALGVCSCLVGHGMEDLISSGIARECCDGTIGFGKV